MSKYKLIFCVIFLQSCDAEERRRHVKADRRPAQAETFVSSRFFSRDSGGRACWRAGTQRGSLKRETDGARQTLVCGFIQIYDGRRVELRGPASRVELRKARSLRMRGASRHSGALV